MYAHHIKSTHPTPSINQTSIHKKKIYMLGIQKKTNETKKSNE